MELNYNQLNLNFEFPNHANDWVHNYDTLLNKYKTNNLVELMICVTDYIGEYFLCCI